MFDNSPQHSVENRNYAKW